MLRRKAFAARVWSKLVAFEKEHALFCAGDRVLAAVSGGPDSVCLAHFLAAMSRRKGFALFLVHVHHGLRGRAADRDADHVRALGRTLGVPVSVARAPVAAAARRRRMGLEEAARKLRYAAIARAARRLRCGKAAVGHQLDDQAETVLLHLLRGTRLAALAAMPPRRALSPGIELLRPLLDLRRAEVQAYLEVHGLKARRDASNRSLKFTRNWVRHRLLPLLEQKQPRVREHLASLAEQVRSL